MKSLQFFDIICEALDAQSIYNKYYNKTMTLNDFLLIVSNDPTSVYKEENDFTPENNYNIKKIGDYVKWLIIQFKTDNNKRFWEDLPRYNNALRLYDRAKKLKVLPEQAKDINRIKNLNALEDIVEPFLAQEFRSKRQEELLEEKTIKEKETTVILDDENWLIVTPLTWRSACYWGMGTRWCTAVRTGNDRTFNSYNNDGPLYILISKHAENKKYQFHFKSQQFMDAQDNEIDLGEFFISDESSKYLLDFFLNLLQLKINFKDVTQESDTSYSLYVDNLGKLLDATPCQGTSYYSRDNDTRNKLKMCFDPSDSVWYETFDFNDDMYSDLDVSTKEMIKEYIVKSLGDNINDLDFDINEENNDVDIIELIENEDDLNDLNHALCRVYTSAKESADMDKAHVEATQTLVAFWGASIKYSDKIIISNLHHDIISAMKIMLLLYFDATPRYLLDCFHETDDEVLESMGLEPISFDEPYYGFSGDIDEEYYNENVREEVESLMTVYKKNVEPTG